MYYPSTWLRNWSTNHNFNHDRVFGPRSDLGPPEYETEVLSTILQYALQRKLNLIFHHAMFQNI